MRRLSVLIAISAGLYCANASAQGIEWQQPLDLLSAGAASAIVLVHICQGRSASEAAADYSSQRFDEEARKRATAYVPANVIRDYLQSAADIKVKALWQANADKECNELTNLRDIGLSTGFLTASR